VAVASGDPYAGEDIAEMMQHASAGTLVELMGIRILEARPGLVRGSMPVKGNTQPYGLLHGGASAVLAETLGSIAASIHGGPDRIAVGIELSCTHHRAVRDGEVFGSATALHEGGTVATYAIVITDPADQAVCTARLTCIVRSRPPRSN
jgi:1,4-dihydroxy-2-naphthoyl-CoA hydrolase